MFAWLRMKAHEDPCIQLLRSASSTILQGNKTIAGGTPSVCVCVGILNHMSASVWPIPSIISKNREDTLSLRRQLSLRFLPPSERRLGELLCHGVILNCSKLD